MNDALEQQLVNELRAMLQELNRTYEGFFHLSVLTLVDLNQQGGDRSCTECIKEHMKCMRCVIGVKEEPQPLKIEFWNLGEDKGEE